jgi:hypothetical protein
VAAQLLEELFTGDYIASIGLGDAALAAIAAV